MSSVKQKIAQSWGHARLLLFSNYTIFIILFYSGICIQCPVDASLGRSGCVPPGGDPGETAYAPTVRFSMYGVWIGSIAYVLGNHWDVSDLSWQKLSSSLFSIDISSGAFTANMLDKHLCLWEENGCLHSETFLVISSLKQVLSSIFFSH